MSNFVVGGVNHPVMYSYRRCPYAMRARLSIVAAGLRVEQREIVFWDKPAPMLTVSPKGTVPVLILPNGEVMDESLDIMLWALQEAEGDYGVQGKRLDAESLALISRCDDEFKVHLDRYKYADRFPEASQLSYRQLGEAFLLRLEDCLAGQLRTAKQPGLVGLLAGQSGLVDLAIFPFIRQFANVDKTWFAMAPYPLLRTWLHLHQDSAIFRAVMKNRPVWMPEHQPLWVDEPNLHNKNEFKEKALLKCSSNKT